MASINITVDGVVRSVESDQRPTHIFADDKSIVVARVNGEIRDLWSELKDGDAVEGVAISSPDGLAVLRHSTAHVLAQAVQQTFAQTRLGIGPPIRDGFTMTLNQSVHLLRKILRRSKQQCARLLKRAKGLSDV